MSKFKGGMIGSVENTPSGTAYTGKANGVWSLQSQIGAKNASLWAIGQTKPDAPSIGTASAASTTSVSVAFIPPVNNGGSPITSYTVTSSDGQTATGTSSPIVVSGLTTGASYTFTVKATSAVGTSVSSGVSNSVVPIGDTYFSNVSLLLNGDDLLDHSGSPKTLTKYGETVVDTTTKKYGSGAIKFDGAGDYLSIPHNADFNFGTGDFTLEAWIYPTSFASYFVIAAKRDNSTSAWQINLGLGNGYLGFYNGTSINSTTAPALNSWSHVAAVYNSGSIKLYLNGIQVLSVATTNSNNTAVVSIGTDAFGNYAQGYIDDLRITKGVARYTANFTPPTTALPTS